MLFTGSLHACSASIDTGKAMSRILVTYATNSGSTTEVAEAIADEICQAGHITRVLPLAEATDLSAYDCVVIGAPMIFGWQAAARKFMKQHRDALAAKKVALFACAMRLTRVPGITPGFQPLALDASLASEPQKAGRMSFKERFTSTGHYLKPMLKAAAGNPPISIAFFGGKLEMFRLKWWQAAFIMAVVQATPGDYRNWEFIRNWARGLAEQL